MNKTVLLTGGAGFIGAHIVEHILKTTNWNLIILDRLSYAGNLNRLTDIDIWWECQDRVKFYYHDFKSQFNEGKVQQLLQLFGNVDYIIHNGANSHVDKSIEDPYPFVFDNVLGTVNMLELCKSLEYLEKFIYISTDEVFGPAIDRLHTEDDPHKPSNPYSSSKAAGEDFCVAYHNTYNLPIIITNTMNIIGERQDSEKFVPKTLKSILNNDKVLIHCRKDIEGNILDISSRCWLHARNQADGLTWLLENGIVGESYNIVGEKLNCYELAKKIANIIDKPLNVQFEDFHSFRPGHDMHYGLDGSKLAQLGWVPPYSLDSSLEKTVKWMINNPQWL